MVASHSTPSVAYFILPAPAFLYLFCPSLHTIYASSHSSLRVHIYSALSMLFLCPVKCFSFCFTLSIPSLCLFLFYTLCFNNLVVYLVSSCRVAGYIFKMSLNSYISSTNSMWQAVSMFASAFPLFFFFLPLRLQFVQSTCLTLLLHFQKKQQWLDAVESF